MSRTACVLPLCIALSTVACDGGSGSEDRADANPGDVDAGRPDASPDGGGDGFQGFVNLTSQVVEDQPFWGYSIYLMAATPGGAACYWGEPRGACCVGLGPVDVPAHLSAGTLTLHNETTGMSGEIPWLADETDYGFLAPAFPWSSGDRLTVSAPGDQVAAFAASATFPAPLEAIDAGTAISLASDWTVRWTPAGASRVVVKLLAGSHTLACPAADQDGELTIPAALLDEAFDPGDGVAFVTRVSAGTDDDNPAIALEGELSLSSPVTFEP